MSHSALLTIGKMELVLEYLRPVDACGLAAVVPENLTFQSWTIYTSLS